MAPPPHKPCGGYGVPGCGVGRVEPAERAWTFWDTGILIFPLTWVPGIAAGLSEAPGGWPLPAKSVPIIASALRSDALSEKGVRIIDLFQKRSVSP